MKKLSKRQLQQIKHFFREKRERAKDRSARFLHRAPSGDARRHEPTIRLMAGKVDQMIIVVSIAAPPLKPGLIDRFLVMAGAEKVDPAVVFNKSDLLQSRREGERVLSMYRSLGYVTLVTSTVSGEGIDALRELARGKTSMLAGHSGVGKSSLLNRIRPGLSAEAEVREVSEATGKGQHATTSIRLYRLDAETVIFDLPGVKLASLFNVEPAEIGRYFPEFASASRRCRYDDCLHIDEPECGVKDALEEGDIAPERYDSYCRIVRHPKAVR